MESIEYLINEIKPEDLEEALDLVWNVFLTYEAPDYAEEGVREFRQFIEYDSIKKKLTDNEFRMWIYKDKGKIKGVLAPRPPCHISLLFVDGAYHKKGIARAMIRIMVDCHKTNRQSKEITVNSSPFAAEAYHKLGFTDTGSEQTVNGIRFIPMKRLL